jgi:uncharacterized protein (DUF1919 family)
MACFTALDYRNKSYPFLQTIQAAAALSAINFSIVSYGCYDAMSDSAKLYQFYSAFLLLKANNPISENCFVQKTEDQQYYLTNEALAAALAPVG